MTPPLHVRDHAGIRAILDDPRFAVPPPPEGGSPLDWLRRTTVRFCEGTDHDRRRAVAEDLLRGLDPSLLRERAAVRTREVSAEAAPFVPVEVLALHLGVSPGALARLVPATRAVAAAYQPGAPAEHLAPADEGVRTLVGLLPDGGPEEAAQRIALLTQSCDSTAGLIRGALAVVDEFGLSIPGDLGAEDLVAEALRLTSPVRETRRRALDGAVLAGRPVPPGTDLVLDFATANRDPRVFPDPDRPVPGRPVSGHLTFGHGRRPCPGSAHALALARGVLDVLLAEGAR
ncbi:cytochrome P450 [Nocardiopsis lucentensis]|uniref:cytochrome P450 n=1 Tax=Nocardiopsis lucentensis TaxID=53441 RepID=UPI00034AD1D7|nr:cytochrome P450 [Nocardiopsis lucentensis]